MRGANRHSYSAYLFVRKRRKNFSCRKVVSTQAKDPLRADFSSNRLNVRNFIANDFIYSAGIPQQIILLIDSFKTYLLNFIKHNF